MHCSNIDGAADFLGGRSTKFTANKISAIEAF